MDDKRKFHLAASVIGALVGACSLIAYGVNAAGFPFRLAAAEQKIEVHSQEIDTLRAADAERKGDVREMRAIMERVEKGVERVNDRLDKEKQ